MKKYGIVLLIGFAFSLYTSAVYSQSPVAGPPPSRELFNQEEVFTTVTAAQSMFYTPRFTMPENMFFRTSVANKSKDTLNRVKVEWQYNKRALHTRRIKGLHIPPGTEKTIQSRMPVGAKKAVAYNRYNNLSITLYANQRLLKQATRQVYFLKDTAQRKVLIEHFTNASCRTCAYMNPFLFDLINKPENKPHVAHIAYHTSWPGDDPMYEFNKEHDIGDARVDFYDIFGTPLVRLSGNYYEGTPKDITQKMLDKAMDRPGLFDININRRQIGDSLAFTIKYVALADFQEIVDNNLTTWLVLTEHLEYDTPPGSNGEKVFPGAMRYMPGGLEGKSLGQPAYKDTLTVEFGQQLDDTVNIRNMKAVVIVQDTSDKEVYMTERKDYIAEPALTYLPADDSAGVSLQEEVQVAFNQPVVNFPGNLKKIAQLRKDSVHGDTVDYALTANEDTSQITLHPDTLAHTSRYYLWLSDTLRNPEGEYFPADTVSFQTIELTAPQVQLYPPDSAQEVPVDTVLRVTYTQPVRYTDASAIDSPAALVDLRFSSAQGNPVDFTAEWEEKPKVFVIRPTDSLAYQQHYFLTITDTLENNHGLTVAPDTTEFTTQQNPATAVAHHQENPFSVYPNPASGNLQVEAADFLIGSNALIEIYTINGRKCYARRITRLSVLHEMDVRALKAGTYILKVSTNNAGYSQIIMIKNAMY